MVHHEDAEYIKLCILRGLVVEEVIIFEEETMECRIVVALGGCENKRGRYS